MHPCASCTHHCVSFVQANGINDQADMLSVETSDIDFGLLFHALVTYVTMAVYRHCVQVPFHLMPRAGPSAVEP